MLLVVMATIERMLGTQLKDRSKITATARLCNNSSQKTQKTNLICAPKHHRNQILPNHSRNLPNFW